MNEVLVEKLIQNITNLISDVNDLNLLVRGLKPSQEILNNTSSRLDAMQAALKEVDTKLAKQEGRLLSMEAEVKLLPAAMDSLRKSVNELPEKAGISPAAIRALKTAMAGLSEELAKPQEQVVRHHHHFKNGMAIAFVSCLLSIGVFILFLNAKSKADLAMERDIKYRRLERTNFAGLDNLLHGLDSSYRSDPDLFRRETVQMEEVRARE